MYGKSLANRRVIGSDEQICSFCSEAPKKEHILIGDIRSSILSASNNRITIFSMALDIYQINRHSDEFYWFISTGVNGDIIKGVFLSPAELPAIENAYNIGLADYQKEEWTDTTVTDNKDTGKVMETVAAVIIDYTGRFPGRSIYVLGHSSTRQRLYQRYASNNLIKIQELFNIYGKEHDLNEFELFEKGKIYEALLVERK